MPPAALGLPAACNGQTELATRPFVTNFHLAAASFRANYYTQAVVQADAAMPHASTTSQLQAVLSIRMESQIALKDDAGLAPTIEQRISLGCLRAYEVDLLPKLLSEAKRRIAENQ